MAYRADQIEIHAFAPEMTADVRSRIDELEQAVDERRRLKLFYSDADSRSTERVVRPLGLWFWGKVWTLVAWCELRNDFRIFRLDRIRRTETGGDDFQPERGKTLADFYRTMEDEL